MTLFHEFEARGILSQTTDPVLADKLNGSESMTFYCGFDPTSDSLHLGNLFALLTMRRLQRAGHRPLLLIGGATGMVGDPSGKSQERNLLNRETLARNVEGIRGVATRFLSFEGPAAAKVVNNADWFGPYSFLDFLREVGKHFTVNHMLGKESVRARLEDREHGISYTEFSYMLLQAYDFYHLAETEGCRLQIGGSDQWGNITAGTELIRRMRAAEGKPAITCYGMTTPLITKADGGKFGKTESGTLWLSADKTSPYQFYQYLLQASDADVIPWLRYFSFKPLEEIARLEQSLKTQPEKREAQHALARELTEIVHGPEEVAKIEQATQALFGGGDIHAMSLEDLQKAFAEAPASTLPRARLLEGDGLPLVDLLAETGLCASKGMARKDIQGGGISLNQERVSDVALKLSAAQLLHGKMLLLRKGKKTYHLVSVT